MDKKWIELLKDVDGHKAGAFIEVDEPIARSYIGAGLAKDGGDGPETILLQRSLDKLGEKLQGMVKATADHIDQATAALDRRRPVIRTADGGVEFETMEFVRGGNPEDKSRSIGDFFRTAYLAISGALTGDAELAQAGHKRMTEVYKVQRTGARGPDLIQRNMTESTGSSLGYTTPVIYEQMILQEAAEEQVFLKGARRVPLGARQVEYPALNQYAAPAAGQSAWYGGVQVYRKGEATQRTVTNAATNKVILMAQDLTCFFELSRDAMQDSTETLSAVIPQLGGGAIGWRSDWEAWNGTGGAQLLGVLNAPCTILVTRNTGSHIKAADVFTMYSKLLPRAKAGAAWYAHPFAMADVMQLQDGSGRNLYLPVVPANGAGPITGKTAGTLLGLPIVESEKMSPLGTAGDLALCAMDRYLYGERAGLEVGLSEHFLFDTDQVAIRLKVRNDGKPQLRAPIYLGDGSQSNQVSAFIVLN